MGFWSRQKNKASRFWNEHYTQNRNGIRQANEAMDNPDIGADEHREWKKLRREYRKRFWMGVGTAGLGVAAAGAVRGVTNAGKNAGNAVRTGSGNYDLLILISIILYASAPVWRPTLELRLTVQLLFLVLALFLIPKEERNVETWTVMAVIFVVETFLPTLMSNLDVLNNKWIFYYLVNPQVTLLWFYFCTFRSDGTTFISKWSKRLVLLLWLGVALSFVMNAFTVDDVTGALTPEQMEAAENLYTETVKWYWDAIKNFDKILEQGKAYWINRIRYATGDYYTGQVDENQATNLGIYLKDIKPSDSEFFKGSPVTVWGLLEAKTLDDGLNIDISCYYGRKDDNGKVPDGQYGEVYPPSPLARIYDEESIDIDCRIDNSLEMQEGTNKVTIAADFNFETMAYLKNYFMDRDEIRSHEMKGENPLEVYGIEDTEPKAKFTNGPVMIGMESADEQPIGITDAYSVKPRLGITLATNQGWTGKIRELKELIVMVPNSMSLDTTWCSEFKDITEEYSGKCIDSYIEYASQQLLECFEEAGLDRDTRIENNVFIGATSSESEAVRTCLEQACISEIENYNAYELKIDDGNRQDYSNFGYDAIDRQYKTFSCRVNLDEPENIMKGQPLAIHNFRVKARYIYAIEESTNVNMKKSESQRDPGDYPVPPDYNKIADVMSYIYSQFYKKEPFSLRTYCESEPLMDDPEKCTCMLASIMAVESNGDVRVMDGDGGRSKFLMQIGEAAATDGWNHAGVQACSLDEVDCNIGAAYYYLKYLQDTKNTKEPNGLSAGYNCGPKALNIPSGCTTPAYECKPDTCNIGSSRNTGNFYVPLFEARYETCMNMDFEESVEVIEPEWADGVIDLKNGTNVYPIEGTPYSIEVRGYDYLFEVTILYKNYQRITRTRELYNSTTFPPEYPFIKFYSSGSMEKILKYSTYNEVTGENYNTYENKYVAKKLHYSYLKKSVTDKISLVKDKKKVSGSEEVKDYTDVFGGWLTIYYDDDIHLYANGKEFCTVPWETFSEQENGYCEQDQPFNVKVINIETSPDDGLFDFSEKRAVVQVRFDPNAEHYCCNDCSTCGSDGYEALSCLSCSNCYVDVYDMTSLLTVCKEGTKEETTTSDTTISDTSTTDTSSQTDCCTDCSCTDLDKCNSCSLCKTLRNYCLFTSAPACCDNCSCTESNCNKCGGACRFEGGICITSGRILQ